MVGVLLAGPSPRAQNALDAAAIALRTDAALRALDRYLETWNSRDPRLWATSLHFPHIRPGPGAFALTRSAEEYAAGVDFEQTASTGWDHSEWVSRDVLQVGADKVHAAGQWQRYTKDGRALATSVITYIVTNQQDRWAIQSRFAAGAGGLDGPAAGANGVAARAAIDRFVAAWNSHDVDALAAAIHYPHVRLADRQLELWASPKEFAAGAEAGRQRTWYQLRIDSAKVVQAAAGGVNVTLTMSRLARDGRVMSRDEGVFLVVLRDGAWKVQARSTFGT